MIEHCATFQSALDSIKCLDELEGCFAFGRFNGEPLTKEQAAMIADKKIAFQKRQGKA